MIKKIVLFFISVAISINASYAGVQILGTRLIYDADKNQASIGISNPDEYPFLVQAWVTETLASKDSADQFFIATPPIFRLDAKTDNSVRIAYNGGALPKDRESVFWLNIKTIPSSSKDSENSLVIAVKSQMKLFYRPVGLPGSPDDAYKSLKFIRENGKLVIKNPTAYSVSFKNFYVNNKPFDDVKMVLPYTDTPIDVAVSQGTKITFESINDYGGVSKLQTSSVTNK